MRLTFALFILALPGLALAQPTISASLDGTTTVVNSGPGDQFDPHVSGDLVAYANSVSGGSEVRYHDLMVGTDQAIPGNGGLDTSPDTSGRVITYTHFGNGSVSIFEYDVAVGTPVEVSPLAGSNRRFSSIGGDTLAWQDFGFTSTASAPEIVAYDRIAHVTVRLTNDNLRDNPPTVSPDGTSVVWTKCAGLFVGCDAWSATLVNGVWTTRALTGAEGEESSVDSDGVLAVYGSNRAGEDDIYWQPVAGGSEQHLDFAGPDRNPRIAGHLVGFEHYDPTSATPNWDLYIYDMQTQNLYRLTNTPVDEEFNDISVGSGGLARVVWDAQGANGTDVFAFSFLVPSNCGGVQSLATPEEICADPGDHPLVAEFTLSRETGKPDRLAVHFPATAGVGVMCVENHRATSGTVSLGGSAVVTPSDFQRAARLVARRIELNADNALDASIAGGPGTSYTLRLYGAPPEVCSGGTASAVTNPAALRVAGVTADQVQTLFGSPARVVGPTHAFAQASLGGCSASAGGLMAPAALALLGLALLRRPRAAYARRS